MTSEVEHLPERYCTRCLLGEAADAIAGFGDNIAADIVYQVIAEMDDAGWLDDDPDDGHLFVAMPPDYERYDGP
jgi:hypothetical protein